MWEADMENNDRELSSEELLEFIREVSNSKTVSDIQNSFGKLLTNEKEDIQEYNFNHLAFGRSMWRIHHRCFIQLFQQTIRFLPESGGRLYCGGGEPIRAGFSHRFE